MTDFITLKGVCKSVKAYKAKDNSTKFINYFDIGGDDPVEVITERDTIKVGQPWMLIISATKFGLRIKTVCPIAIS